MTENEMIDLIRSVPGGDVAAAKKIGVSVGLLRAIRQGRRGVTDDTAKLLGYRRCVTVTFEPAAPVQPVTSRIDETMGGTGD